MPSSNIKQFGHISMSLYYFMWNLTSVIPLHIKGVPHWFSNKLYIKLFVVKISHLTGYKDKYLDKLTD